MISDSFKQGIVVVDGVEVYCQKWLLNQFKSQWNADFKRLDFKRAFAKEVRDQCSDTYYSVKELVARVSAHCPALLRASLSFRLPLCAKCAFETREVQQKLVNHTDKAGFHLNKTSVYSLISYQANHDRDYVGKRPKEREDVQVSDQQVSEAEQTPRKLSKTESNVSFNTVVGDEESSFGSIDDTDLTVQLPEDTVIPANTQQEEEKPASPQDIKGHIVINRQVPERDLTEQELEYYHSIYAATDLCTQDHLYTTSPAWSEYISELNGYYSTELNEFGSFNLNAERDDNGFHYYKDKQYFDIYEQEKFVYFGPLDGEANYDL